MNRLPILSALCAMAVIAAACTQEADSVTTENSAGDAPAAQSASETISSADAALTTSMCGLRETPDAFDGMVVTLRARYVDLNSYAMLADPECPNWALRYIRLDLAPSDAEFDGSTEFLEYVLMHGSTTFFTDMADVYADFTGTYYREREGDNHVLVAQSVANVTYTETAPE